MFSARGRVLRWTLASTLVLSGFAAGLVAATYRPSLSWAGRFDPYRKLGVFARVLSYVESNYVENISEQALMYGAARGLTDALDPHSRFMDPEEYDRLRRDTEGDTEIEGIGIDVEMRKDSLVIVSPIEGSPADKAGLASGDVITKIDGTPTKALEWNDAVSRIQGAPGSTVVLTIDRNGKEIAFTIRRAKFEVKAVEGHLYPGDYGFAKVRIFSTQTDAQLQALLSDFDKQAKDGIKGVVLDMRRNPGGLLDQGVKVADRFLSEGLIVRTVGKGGREMDRQVAHKRGTWKGFPMVVLVDEATASAAEIVAGALQDHKRAVIMGSNTFGKGSVQTVFSLDGCGAKPCGLKITVARYYTPSGRSIQNRGITPNIFVGRLPPPAADDGIKRERDFEGHLNNEQGDEPESPRVLPDHALQVALDYLRSFEIFARQK